MKDDTMNELGGVQLWEGGPFWAECNIGATKPEEYGYYFWWGDTVGYKYEERMESVPADGFWASLFDKRKMVMVGEWNAVNGSRKGFEFSEGNCPTYGKSVSALRSMGYLDKAGNLTAAHDAATAHLGKPWRLPTMGEFKALCDNCDTEWTQRNGVWGRLVKGRGAFSTKSIFLPAAGFGFGGGSALSRAGSYGGYWSATPDSGDSGNAWDLCFDSGNFDWDDLYRCYGQSARALCPLREFAE